MAPGNYTTYPDVLDGELALLAPVVIPGSQHSNFTFNIFVVLVYLSKRVSTNEDCCRCHSCRSKSSHNTLQPLPKLFISSDSI